MASRATREAERFDMLRSPLAAFVIALAPVGAVAVVSAVSTPAAARTRSADERRASLVWLLAETRTQLTREGLEALGPNTDELLISIANAPKAAAVVRVRALAGLAFYPNDATYAFLASLLNERNLIGNDTGLRMRRQALRSLGVFGERAVDDLLSLKTDAEPGIRQAVALALGDTGSERALPVLELWLTTEPVLTVREAVDRAVEQLHRR